MSYETERLLTPNDVARIVQVNRSTVMRAIAAGDLDAFRDGIRWKIAPVAIRIWMNRRSNTGRSPMTPIPPLRLLTVAEAGALLRISRATTYRLIETGAIPVHRVGGSIRIDRQEMLAALGIRPVSVASISSREAARFLAGAISGQIVGMDLQGRKSDPPSEETPDA